MTVAEAKNIINLSLTGLRCASLLAFESNSLIVFSALQRYDVTYAIQAYGSNIY
jgi:hypothetical protein